MAPEHAGIASDIEQLSQMMRELEQRVSALESQREKQTSARPEPAAGSAQTHPLASPQLFPSRNLPVAAVPVLGKAVLGIAGAYLLRAIFESGRVPQWPVLAVAVLYAGTWLIWAVKSHATSQFASVTYGITVALIFMPFLWECTVRFQILPPSVTAAVLVAFVVFALALAWQQDLQALPWIATLASVATALALIVATHELAALTTALLAVALLMEVAASLGHRLSVRAVSAIAADFAVWLLVDIATSDGGVPHGYAPIGTFMLTALCFALLAIYAGSIGLRSFALRERLAILDVAQGAVAFLIGVWGMLRASHGGSAPVVGILVLVAAGACYWGALSRFTAEADTRNRRVYAVYAAALLLAGSFLLLSANLQELFLCLAAIAAALVYSRTAKLSLGLHTSVFLVAAAIASPVLESAKNALAGTVPVSTSWEIWILGVSAVLCYLIGARVSDDDRRWRLLWIVPAVLFSLVAATLTVIAVAWLALGRVELSLSRLAVVRTVVTCLLALVLSFLGSIWKRIELGWLAYAIVGFGTLKLLFEDLRFGESGALVISLLFYGLILILIPRLTSLKQAGS